MVLPSNKKLTGTAGAVALIVTALFAVEGGYVFDPRDPGGETNHGITKAVAVSSGYLGAMKELTQERAGQIYTANYIVSTGYWEIVALSPAVGEKLIDAGVNAGPGRSSRWFQTALNAVNRGGKDYPTISVDGQVGLGSVAAYRSLQKVRGKQGACELIIKMVDAQQTMHYLSLPHLNVYTTGWLTNRIGNVPLSRCANE